MKSTKQVIEELKKEKAELSEKIFKLENFLSDKTKTDLVGALQVRLMQHQLECMIEYATVLNNRIYVLELMEDDK
ncbi:crAss001_48 related protein [Ligilactobacillus murinus]|uniref:Uncharacterized protein n=1 Tax=Ligilactobacillus murinus TaxID=1622 RepID=A0AAE6WJ39_9LACO|nr:hypothetical protein [Ligilactobacillus murinus]MDE7023206.1 hypothetical protein [Ligilactobacillus sp.]NEF81899.1 hypothetical protein [Ligilactobacillus murinus]NEF84027.1 hypothetical protein [Ligilactobacillus murinus]NEF86388.1 hypothetical protein [Ligilactobacillus murinus]NEF88737.1 hypothetical protein [Ligilactobacillus murinus]